MTASSRHYPGRIGRIAATLLLLWCGWSVATRAAAGWYGREATIPALERARRLDPADPRHAVALARARLATFDEDGPAAALALLERAAALSPREAERWAELGAAYEFAGREADAARAFERATALAPFSPLIAWQAANFHLRAGHLAEALESLRIVLEGDPERRTATFDLAWRAGADDAVILDRMLPPREEMLLAALDFLAVRDRLDSAAAVWDRLRRGGWPQQPQSAFPYLEALLRHRQADKLREVWREVYPAAATGANLVTNPDFRSEPLGGGLDWRVYPAEGARASLVPAEPAGARALCVEFEGRFNLRYEQVFQYLPVEPKRRYVFRARVRGRGVTTDSGPRLEVFDTDAPLDRMWATAPLLGDVPWRTEEFEIETGPQTRVLVVRLFRPPSRRLDNRIAGSACFTAVRLEPLDGRRPPAPRGGSSP